MSADDFLDYDTPPTFCPDCGERFSAAAPVGHVKRPKDGDVSVCIYCAGIGIYEIGPGIWRVRAPTAEEWATLRAIPQLAEARAAVLRSEPVLAKGDH